MILRRLLLLLVLFLAMLPLAAHAQSSQPRCFSETNQCIEGRFRDYWEQNGGLAVFGFPITVARQEFNSDTGQSYLTQWFERNRFELHPENQAPYDVLLGRLSDTRLRQTGVEWQTAPREDGPQQGCLWFAETGHNVCNQGGALGFRQYWETHGLRDSRLDLYARSLALFGLPLTAPRPETNAAGDTVITQWFERARFEWHPNEPDDFKVLLGLLGNELQNTSPAPAQTGPITYAAIGDSLAAGLFADEPYVKRYAQAIGMDSGRQVTTTNLGRIAWSSGQLLDALRSNATFRTAVASAQIVTWNIGGNDLRDARQAYRDRRCGGTDNQDCLRSTVTRFKQNWDAILGEIQALARPGQTALRTMDIYNPYVQEDSRSDSWSVDGGLNDYAVFRTYLDDTNRYITSTSAAQNIPVAHVFRSFNGPDGTQDPSAAGLIAFDNLHPNDAGHERIADLLRGLGYAPIK